MDLLNGFQGIVCSRVVPGLQRALLVIATLGSANIALGQTCSHQAQDGNGTTIEGTILALSSCSEQNPLSPGLALVPAPDSFIQGGWVKQGSLFDVHTSAMTTGRCVLRATTGWPPICQVIGEQLRTINKVKITDAPPGLLPTVWSRFSLNEQGGTVFRQTLDTMIPGTTSGPLHKTAFYVGQWTFAFQSVVNTTSCNILPASSEIKNRGVFVTKCRPYWMLYNSKMLRAPAGTVYLYLAPHLSAGWGAPLQQAVEDWNGRLSGGGVPSFQVVNYDCGSGGDCVSITEGTPSSGCAEMLPGVPGANGEYVSSAGIVVLPGRQGDLARRTFAHEMGHLVGLRENDPECALADSVMSPRVAPMTCEDLPSGTALGPSDADGAAARSSYNSSPGPDEHPRRVCGF